MFTDRDITFLRFRDGNAFYYVDTETYMETMPFDDVAVFHLLSGDPYAHLKDRFQIVAWELIPKDYKMDACSLNPFIRGNTDEFPIVGSWVVRKAEIIYEFTTKLFSYVRKTV